MTLTGHPGGTGLPVNSNSLSGVAGVVVNGVAASVASAANQSSLNQNLIETPSDTNPSVAQSGTVTGGGESHGSAHESARSGPGLAGGV